MASWTLIIARMLSACLKNACYLWMLKAEMGAPIKFCTSFSHVGILEHIAPRFLKCSTSRGRPLMLIFISVCVVIKYRVGKYVRSVFIKVPSNEDGLKSFYDCSSFFRSIHDLFSDCPPSNVL